MSTFFKEKVALVTGASDGIGLALAKALLAQGARVAVCARNAQKLAAAYAASDPGDRLLTIQADVTNLQECEAFVQAAIARWGRVDMLINNAGASMRALFADADVDVLRRLMDVNFYGAVHCTKAALPYILQSKGIIMGVSSIAGYRGLPARTGYSASKFALQGFLESLRTELLHTGAHVMWVAPGFTASNIRNVALGAGGEAQQESPLDEGKLMSADQCAGIILNAAAKRKRTVVMTGQGRLTVWLSKLMPGLADKLVYNHFANEPDSPLPKVR